MSEQVHEGIYLYQPQFLPEIRLPLSSMKEQFRIRAVLTKLRPIRKTRVFVRLYHDIRNRLSVNGVILEYMIVARGLNPNEILSNLLSSYREERLGIIYFEPDSKFVFDSKSPKP